MTHNVTLPLRSCLHNPLTETGEGVGGVGGGGGGVREQDG